MAASPPPPPETDLFEPRLALPTDALPPPAPAPPVEEDGNESDCFEPDSKSCLDDLGGSEEEKSIVKGCLIVLDFTVPAAAAAAAADVVGSGGRYQSVDH